jgi:hypothetical protein
MSKSAYTWRLGVILGVAILIGAVLFSFPPIAQDPSYHNFADNRSFLNVPNFADVFSNLPFIVVGLLGLQLMKKLWDDDSFFSQPSEKWIWSTFFLGTVLISFGSSYYHLKPNNFSLIWDRLPITIAFMSLFASIIAERIHFQAGIYLFPILLVMGIGSVTFWQYTEQQGIGDLRPYLLVQIFPIVVIPLMLILFPAQYTGVRFLLQALGWYVLAKLLELFDTVIFGLLQGTISGHTLKHLASGVAAYSLFKYVKCRQKVPEHD